MNDRETLDALKVAGASEFVTVTVDGVRWVRDNILHEQLAELRAQLETTRGQRDKSIHQVSQAKILLDRIEEIERKQVEFFAGARAKLAELTRQRDEARVEWANANMRVAELMAALEPFTLMEGSVASDPNTLLGRMVEHARAVLAKDPQR